MKMQTKLFKILSFILVLAMFSTLLISCDNEETPNVEDATKLSFKAASGYDYLKTINGQTVTISGYMATSSLSVGRLRLFHIFHWISDILRRNGENAERIRFGNEAYRQDLR